MPSHILNDDLGSLQLTESGDFLIYSGVEPTYALIWNGVTLLTLTWAGGDQMIKTNTPVRANTPIFIEYQFMDENAEILDLSDYVSASLELKQQGDVYATIVASMATPLTEGKTFVSSHSFDLSGIWSAQFILKDANNKSYYGEPIQFVVATNVDDLTSTELLRF